MTLDCEMASLSTQPRFKEKTANCLHSTSHVSGRVTDKFCLECHCKWLLDKLVIIRFFFVCDKQAKPSNTYDYFGCVNAEIKNISIIIILK